MKKKRTKYQQWSKNFKEKSHAQSFQVIPLMLKRQKQKTIIKETFQLMTSKSKKNLEQAVMALST